MVNKVATTAHVVENCAVNPGIFLLKLHVPAIATAAKPGQFVMVGIGTGSDPLLKRPLGIADTEPRDGIITIIYRVVGRGTELLTAKRIGDAVDIIGPLGHGFDLGGERPLLVGGGMGLAPLLFAAQQMCPKPVEVMAGGRTKDEMFWADLFRKFCDQVHVTTDDGTLGARGTCVDLLPQIVEQGHFDSILACGPTPMLRSVAEYAKRENIPCQLSLEKHMACGFGACLTCTCGAAGGGYYQVCKHGPVFKAEEVDLG